MTPSRDVAAALPGLEAMPVIGILRRCPPRLAVSAAAEAVEAGITVLEVTLDSDDFLGQLHDIRSQFPTATVGLGSVTNRDDAITAVAAGAAFVVAPTVNADVIHVCMEASILVVPGAATPTEIAHALGMGAPVVKIFPADLLGGPAYLRAILSPLGRPPLIPTGGITPQTASAYLNAGALAVGAGSSLFPPVALAAGDTAVVRRAAEAFVSAVSSALPPT